MSLSEKAKTLPEWHEELHKKGEADCGSCIVLGTKDACSDCAEILGMHPKLVRLEDARQEIDGLNSHYKKLAKDRDNLWKIVQSLTNEVNDYASESQKNLAERGEQKQKLQQFEEFLVAWTENDMKGYIYDYGKKNAHYYPSQDLDLVLDFFFGLREVLE